MHRKQSAVELTRGRFGPGLVAVREARKRVAAKRYLRRIGYPATVVVDLPTDTLTLLCRLGRHGR
jgi:hypothetical protein